jgi:voltage-gated potassium channel Kch
METIGTIESERGRFTGLLIAQLLFIFMMPFVSESTTGTFFRYLGLFAILAAGLYAASKDRTERRISMVILIPVLFAWLGPSLMPKPLDELLRYLTPAICFGFTAYVVIRDVYRHERVTTDTILGAINVYLLISFAFMFLHASVLMIRPDAYLFAGEPILEYFRSTPDSRGFSTMLYFSFTTLTTLGYGDIVPAAAFARLVTSAEAVIGQLFVAIIIGRLVGLEVSSRAMMARSSISESDTALRAPSS